MITYNHAFDFAFEITSECKDGKDIAPEIVAAAIIKRVNALLKSGQLIEAVDVFDTHVEVNSQTTTTLPYTPGQ
jgi:hypothetical protein